MFCNSSSVKNRDSGQIHKGVRDKLMLTFVVKHAAIFQRKYAILPVLKRIQVVADLETSKIL